MEEKKNDQVPEIGDEQLDKVSGGVVFPPPLVEEASYWVTATAECQKCHN